MTFRHRAGVRLYAASSDLAQPCVFVKQLPGPILCAPPRGGDPFSRSYGASLPSSLTVNLSSASVSSTRPPVSVCGTGRARICLADFLGSMFPAAVRSPGGSRYCRVSAPPADLPAGRLPTRFNALFRQCAGVPLLRLRIAPLAGDGMLTVCPSGKASRPSLRPRLTLIRLALIRNPWPSGGRVSRPPCRYSYLHLLFRTLQDPSRDPFAGGGMLPYRAP